jgi:hypothetical protein
LAIFPFFFFMNIGFIIFISSFFSFYFLFCLFVCLFSLFILMLIDELVLVMVDAIANSNSTILELP